jgi:hypothetical protein
MLSFCNLKRSDYLRDVSVDGRIILECIFQKYAGMFWTGLFRLKKKRASGRLF